jgi:hypothetical protein
MGDWTKGLLAKKAGLGVVAASLFIIATTELSFGVFTPFWDRLQPVGNLKAHQYARFLKRHGAYDTAFVGSSLPFMGIDPETVDAIASTRSYNAGRFGYGPLNLVKAVTTEIIAARPEVRTLVLIVDSWVGDRPDRDRKIIDSYWRPDLRSQSAVFRNRGVFWHWIKRLAAGTLISPREAWKDHLFSSGRLKRWGSLRLHADGYLEANGLVGTDWREYLRPRPFGDHQRRLLEDVSERSQTAGVRLIFLRMPEYVRTYRESVEAHRQVSEVLQSIARPRGLRVIDYSLPGSFQHDDESLFWDMHHLNAKGAEIFSRALGNELAKIVESSESTVLGQRRKSRFVRTGNR